VSSTDTEQQLRIWKDLAISKQMLMNEAASALKLREDCSADELRRALEAAVGAEKQLINGRKDNAEAVKKAKRLVDDKQRELKAINTALADTPDNILKKLKTLKKQKLDESNSKKVAEDANRKLKKEIKEKTEELDSLKALSENSAKLVEAYRDLVRWAKDNAGDAEGMPDLDESILSEIDTITASDAEVEDTREAATA